MDLEYTVTNQVIKKSNRGRPANLSQKYLRLCFEFTEDWTGLTKFALFKVGGDNYRQALDGDKVIVPALVLRENKFLFTLYGIDNNDLRVTTNLVRVDLLESGFVHDAIGDDELDDPNVVEEIYIAIDKKANTSDMTTALAGKSNVGHTHTASDITDLTTEYYDKTEVDNLINSFDNKILLTGDKTIIQAEETMDFTMKTKSEGFPLIEETVELYNGEDMRIKLGEATTNSQGIAVYEYTGTGAGELKVKAKAGTLLSETYSIFDAIFYDPAIDDTKAESYTASTGLDVSYLDDDAGTNITSTETSGNRNYSVKVGDSTSWRDTGKDYCIEFECSYVNNTGSSNILFGGVSLGIYRLNGNATSGSGTVKIVSDGSTYTPYWNGVAVTAQAKTMTGTGGFVFQINKDASTTFKNLKIYYI